MRADEPHELPDISVIKQEENSRRGTKRPLKMVERPFLLHNAENIQDCLVYASRTHQSQCEAPDEGSRRTDFEGSRILIRM